MTITGICDSVYEYRFARRRGCLHTASSLQSVNSLIENKEDFLI